MWVVTGEGAIRAECNALAYAKIRAAPASAWLKLADRVANVEASASCFDKLAMYCGEHASFRAALEGLGSVVMWQRLDAALAR